MKIALVQLCSFGDCLYATLIARQIRTDHPGCHLTWVIGDRYASILDLNPHVDAVHRIPVRGVSDAISDAWFSAREWTEAQVSSGLFDKAYFTQILPDNLYLYNGLIRATIYRAYPNRIEPPFEPIVALSPSEADTGRSFAAAHSLPSFENVFMFECGPMSDQSPMSPQRAEGLAHALAKAHPTTAFCLSSASPLKSPSHQVIDASSLSYRENLALIPYCTGLIGCSSGITWLSTASGVQLHMLQILASTNGTSIFASVVADFRQFGGDITKVIEMEAPTDSEIHDCVSVWIKDSHEQARGRFHQELRPGRNLCAVIYRSVRNKFGITRALQTLMEFVRANGPATIPWGLIWSEPPSLARSFVRRCLSWMDLTRSRKPIVPQK